jgi:hypothetical protein
MQEIGFFVFSKSSCFCPSLFFRSTNFLNLSLWWVFTYHVIPTKSPWEIIRKTRPLCTTTHCLGDVSSQATSVFYVFYFGTCLRCVQTLSFAGWRNLLWLFFIISVSSSVLIVFNQLVLSENIWESVCWIFSSEHR